GFLMVALVRAGRHVDALAQYRSYTTHLGDEYGLEPGAELRDLHASILRQESVGGHGATESVRAQDSPAGPGDAPLRPPPVPGRLPPVPGGFLGRGRELALLSRLAAPGQPPPLVITGPAGVGKTALAVRFAHTVASAFHGGQFYVDLHGWSDDPPLSPG